MKRLLKRTAIIYMMLTVVLSMMPVLGTATGGVVGAQPVYAESETDVNVDGFKLHLWYGSGGASVAVRSYSGSGTQVVLPSSVSYGGNTYKAAPGKEDNWFFIEKGLFAGNKTITKIAIPGGYGAINSEAFSDCTGLTEVSVGAFANGEYGGIGSDAFKGCTNLKTYNIDSSSLDAAYKSGGSLDSLKDQIKNAGIGIDASGNAISGVTVWTQEDSVVWQAITELNAGLPADKKITLKASSDPYSRNTISGGSSGGGSSGGGSSFSETKGDDGTAYGKGASESVVDKAITHYAKESDPKGTVFSLLKAKISKVTKNTVTIKWSKVNGATRYAVYGNACGAKNRLVRLKSTGKTKVTFKQVNKKKVKKGTYYKFMIVAFDKNNKVVSTSKIVHAATKGGKVGNDKSVTIRAKVNAKGKAIKTYKVLSKTVLKKGKSITIKAKATPQSKKLKVKRHRKVAFESSNTRIATVSNKGKIKAKAKGTCYIYAYAQNGIMKRIKITVR